MVKSSTSPRLGPRSSRLLRRTGKEALKGCKPLLPWNKKFKQRLLRLHQPPRLNKSICLTWGLPSRPLHPKPPLLPKASSPGSLSTLCRVAPVQIPGNNSSNRIRLTYSTWQRLLALYSQLRIQAIRTSLTYLVVVPRSQHSSLRRPLQPRCLQVLI